MLTNQEKEKIIKGHQQHELDTGSSEVQVALLTEEIQRLTDHLKKHSKDFHSKRGLLKMVNKRRILLKYIKREDEKKYNELVKTLKLTKE